MFRITKRTLWQVVLVGTLVSAAIVLSVFSQWEMSGETWGYWLFARIFGETGEFVIPDRSPVYTLYLNLFQWIGYPGAIHVEYIVTSGIVVLALIMLFKRHMGLAAGTIAVLLWLPYLQWAEPPVQKLALACSAYAMLLRQPEGRTSQLAGSYSLLGLAYLLRGTYGVLLIVFVVWDLYRLSRGGGAKKIIELIRPKVAYWPVGIVASLFLLFSFAQSSHPWNNAWYGTTTWAPIAGESLLDGHFFQDFNTGYILSEYGTFVDKDIYFSNEEVFGGANTILGAVQANPQFVAQQVARNIKNSIERASQVTEVWWFYQWLPRSGGFRGAPFYGIAVGILALVLFGAIRASGKDRSMVVFIVGSVLVTSLIVTGLPKLRYLVPLIPVLSMGGFWYGTQARRGLLKLLRSSKRRLIWFALGGWGSVFLWFILRVSLGAKGDLAAPFAIVGFLSILFFVLAAAYAIREPLRRLLTVATWLVVPAILILFSNGANGWWTIGQGTVNDVPHPRTRAEVRESFSALDSLTLDCNGIMTLEATFAAAFLSGPVDRVSDLFEIPPFGSLGDSPYDGLRPDRIDCVLESERLVMTIGNSFNIQLRYQNYVEPYIAQLQALGATSYDIEGYGRAIILR